MKFSSNEYDKDMMMVHLMMMVLRLAKDGEALYLNNASGDPKAHYHLLTE